MNKCYFLLVLFYVSLTSCDEFEDLGRSIGWIDSVGYRYEYLTKEMGKCEGTTGVSCVKVDYKGLLTTKGVTDEAAQLIHNDLEGAILTINGSKAGSLQDFFYDILKGYDEFIIEFPQYSGAWEWRISQEVNYNKNRLLGVTILNYSFTGGDRGNTKIYFRNFNANTGLPFTLDSLFENEAYTQHLMPLLKQGLELVVSPTGEKSLQELGFMNVDDNLLTDNFRVGVEGLVFFYNAFDFGSADGPFEVIVPWNKIEAFLSSKGTVFIE